MSDDEYSHKNSKKTSRQGIFHSLRQPWLIPMGLLIVLLCWLQFSTPDPSGTRGKSSMSDTADQIKALVSAEVRSALLNMANISRATDFPPVKTISESEMLRILVTGGAGFVGSNLVDRLMMAGHVVIVVDNMFTGRKKNIMHWMGHPHFTLINHDVVDPIKLEVDQIYHLACPASPPHYQYNPIKTVKTSVMGTLNMLGLSKRIKARMLLTSTSEVYGDPKESPQKETYWGHVNPIGPRACYDEGKRVAETMMYAYKEQSNLEVRVARIFNTFGPRMHPNDGRVVSNFIIQALQGKDITIYGDGSQTRSFQYVDDLVEGLIRLMNGNYSGPVNIGNPEEFRVQDFATLVKETIKSPSKIINLPATRDDPKQRKPDISLAWEQLQWRPKVPVRDGILKTIEYFRKELIASGEIIPTGPDAARPQHTNKQSSNMG